MSDFIKFLGTAGARVVVAKQLRASGGIWISMDDTNLLIDPGPGSLVRCWASRPKLDPTTLDAIILSHKHLDHSADMNVMMEAMTIGGKQPKGMVLVPKDAVSGNDPVIYKYIRPYVSKIEIMQEKGSHLVKNLKIATPVKHVHGVETYGLEIKGKKHRIAYVTDTKYFKGLEKKYRCDILILSVLFPTPLNYDHLSVKEAKKVIKGIKAKTTILTHFGGGMIKAKPWVIAEDLSRELKQNVIAASDGMAFEIK